MASHGGVRTKIALLGSYGRPNRPIAGMRHIFVYYASLRSKLKKKTISRDAQYPQLHSPARAQQESEKCSREVVPAANYTGCRRPDPVIGNGKAANAVRTFLYTRRQSVMLRCRISHSGNPGPSLGFDAGCFVTTTLTRSSAPILGARLPLQRVTLPQATLATRSPLLRTGKTDAISPK